MNSLWHGTLVWDQVAAMLTLVQIPKSSHSSTETTTLVADYLAFDRRRTARRQYSKAFGGMAVLVVIGALFGRVAVDEAQIVAGLLLLPPSVLVAAEYLHRWRLIRRLHRVRAEVQDARIVKKS